MSFSYQNPIWPDYFADPFILHWQGYYYAFGTGSSRGNKLEGDERAFPLLRSIDLLHWEDLGGAMDTLQGGNRWAYWAPEVAATDDGFFLYYSAAPEGRDEEQRLRVARSTSPMGPYVDTGRQFCPEVGFSIDAHPFRDPRDGTWYLFFAHDFFDGRVGTGIAVAPLASDMMSLAGPPRAAVRATADWQIYERNRLIYGRRWEAWHTVEGPCVAYQHGLYWCFYSGGNWQTEHYGVSVACAPHPLGPWTEPDASDGPKLMKQVPGRILGPGHNSLTATPDGKTSLIVYHAWDAARTGRRMFIDPLEWTPEGPRTIGPTDTRQEV